MMEMNKGTESSFSSIKIEKPGISMPHKAQKNSRYTKVITKPDIMSPVMMVNSCHQPLRFVSCKRRAVTAKLGINKAIGYTAIKKPKSIPITIFIAIMIR